MPAPRPAPHSVAQARRSTQWQALAMAARLVRESCLTLHPDQPRAVLAHVDCGPLDLDDAFRPGGLAARIDSLMQPAGIVVSDWPMRARRWHQVPFEVPSFPYFVYRVSHD